MDNFANFVASMALIISLISLTEPRATVWPKIRDWWAKRSIRTVQAQKHNILKEYKKFAYYHENGYAAILHLLNSFFYFMLHTWFAMILVGLLLTYILRPLTTPAPPINIVDSMLRKLDRFAPVLLAIGSFGFLSAGLLDIGKLTKHSYRLTHFAWYKELMEARLSHLTGEPTALPDPKDIEPMRDPPVR